MNKIKLKKLLSLVLSMAIILSVIPQMAINVEASQATAVTANGADGSELRPYIIDEADDLVWLGEQVEAGTMASGKHFMQIKDIDLSGYTWTPIGTGTKNFNGNYNGNGYTISNLTVSSTLDNVGLFGYVSGGSIKNLTLSNASVTCIAPASGQPKMAGALAGYCYGDISNCHVTGSSNVVSNVAYTTTIGGLVGMASNVSKCSSNATVSSSHTHSTMGGIIGSTGNVENSYFTGSVNNTSGAAVGGTGGISGYIRNKSVKNCFSSGSISTTSTQKGAIVGNVYNDNSTYINSSDNNYYLTGTASYGYGSYYNGSTTSASNTGTTALSDSQLKASGSYAGSWDFSTVWKIDGGYPYLRKIGTVTTTSADTSDITNILINAEVTGDGYDTISERGVEYLNVGDTSFTKIAASGGGTGSYSVSLAGIGKGIYFIRAYATNNVGTTYGDGVVVSYTPAGSGTVGDPYIINSADDLNFVRCDLDAYYTLACDLNLVGTPYENWNPIGSSTTPFVGNFDGNGHVISGYTAKIYMDSGMGECSGLFGSIGAGGTVAKLGVNGAYTSAYCVGGIAACNNGTISECFNSGDISSTFDYTGVGGIVGYNEGTVENCYNTGNISGNTSQSPYAGGISGYDASGAIINCYNTGNIYVGASGYGAGITPNGISVTGCFNAGTISGPVGETVNLAGISIGGTRTNCDFLDQTDLTIDGGTSSATGQADLNYFTVSTSGTSYDNFYSASSWDFTNTWRFMNGNYPILMAFPAPYSATLSSSGSLTEANLNDSVITITLGGTTFNSSIESGNFTLNNAPAGVSVSSVNRTGDTTCDVTLSYNGTDFDEDKNMSISIAGSEVASASTITSDTVVITAAVELAPTATTSAATSVTSTSATINGSVNANNLSTNVTFEYGTDTSYGTSVTAVPSSVTGTTPAAVSYALTALTPNTTYHYRVVGVNGIGTTNGEDQTFTTSAVASTATTSAATGVTATTATLNGSVNANNASTDVTFEYGTDTNYGTSVTAVPSSVTGTSLTAVSYALTGLTPNTTYHYRVVGINGAGTTNGSDQTFTTSAVASTVTTSVATSVTSTSATLNGSVNANNTSTTITFEYGTDTSYGTSVTAVPSTVTGTSLTDVSYALTGLTPNTTYHYRVVGASGAGTTTGDDQTFTTTAVAPTATTSTATSVTSTSATLNGSVNANNTSTTVRFEYGTDTLYGMLVTAVPGSVTGTSPIAVNYALTGLTPNTTYHYRVVGINGAGTTNGSDQTFTTSAVASTVTTSVATSVTSTSATLNGSVNANNTSTTVTFEYGTSTSYGTSVTAVPSSVAGTSPTAVSYALSGLTPNTIYHYRVVGSSSAGTVNGSDKTFTTSAIASIATTSTATGVTATEATLNGSVNANNANTTVTFEYGTDTSYGTSVTASQSPVTGTSVSAVSYVLTGLTPNTTYHYRVVGTSTGGTVNGDDQTFTTSAVPSTVTTSTATSVTDTQATLNGSVNANNASTSVTFEYGTDTSYGTSVTAVPGSVTGTSLTAVSYSLSGLTPETTYHYIVVGSNSAGTVYGEDKTFTTLAAPPTKLVTPTGLAWDSVNKTKAIWDEVSSASSYSVQLYKDSIASGSEVTGITTPYYDFASVITEKGVYTYSVTAIGDGTVYSNSDSATVGSGLSAYAVAFKNNYNNSDTSVYTTNVLLAGSKATAPTPPTRTGYTFEGWYTENSCATAWDFANNTVTNNTNLYAKWVTVPSTTYTVTYNGNGATSGSVPVDNNAYASGTTVQVKGNTGNLAKEGYVFGGWSNNGTTYTSGENLTVLGNTTLTAVWNPVQSTYTATYKFNYIGGGVYTTQTGIASGAFLTAPSQPNRSGYTFSGWYKDASCTEQWLFNTDTVTGNVNLFAKWIQNTYSVMGTVINDEATPANVDGATVTVKMGNIQIGSSGTTDVNGNFIITGVPVGVYNLVVEHDGKTVTKFIKVEDSNFVMTSPVIIPTQSKSSIVVITGTNTPPVVVGGLDNEVNSSTTTTTSSTFIITLTVEENPSSANANDVEQEVTTSGKQIGLMFDIDLNKIEDGVEDTSYNETSNLLEIMIPLPEQLFGKEGYEVYRYHEGAVDKITEAVNEHGEYIEVNAEKTILTLHAKKFSTYAIAYTAPSTYSVQFVGGEGATGIAPTQADTAEGETITLPANTFSKTNYTFAGWSDGTNTYSVGASYVMQGSSVTFTAQWTYSGSHSSSGGGGGSSTVPSYTIKTTVGEGGSISPQDASVLKGGSKTFAIKANTGYEIKDVKVDGISVGAVSSYTFSNISEKHTIEAEFSVVKVEEEVIKEGLPYYVDDNGNTVFIGFASDASGEIKYIAPQGKTVMWKNNPKSFTDISNHWAKAYIDFVTERELFLGTSSNTFSPNVGMTRGMFATVIGRLYQRSYGEIATTDNNKFTDVNYDLYYGDYVNWAASNNIISGVGNGKFEPNREITREEMAVIIYRFANFLDISISESEELQQSYPDLSSISAWAQDGAKYCQKTGIISGRDGGKFVPKSLATRAEVAVILERFIDKAVQ